MILFWFTRRTKRSGPCRQRPLSEGTINFNSLLSSGGPTKDEKTDTRGTQWASAGADPWWAGQDLPSLLQEVSLKGCRDSGEVFPEDTAPLQRRRVNLFSSLRLRRRRESESEGPDHELQKEIRTILTNLRNKGKCASS